MTNNIQKIQINNRSYIWDGNKDDFSTFRIEEDNPVPTPNYFTKYFKLSEYNIDALLNNYIYAAHPKEFNDPFDCYSRLIDPSAITVEEIENVEKRLNIKKDRDCILNGKLKKLIEILYYLLFEGLGIISLTDSKNENPSLWANYTENHKGFSTTYKIEALKKIAIGPFKVDYIENLIKLKYKSEIFNALVLWLICTKSKYWSNEEEWRFIGIGKDKMYVPYEHLNKEKEILKNNRKLDLPIHSVTEVKLGFRFFDHENISENNLNEKVVNLNNENDKNYKIKLLNHVKTNKIPLSLIHLSDDEFKFKSMKLDYDFIKETNTFKWKLNKC